MIGAPRTRVLPGGRRERARRLALLWRVLAADLAPARVERVRTGYGTWEVFAVAGSGRELAARVTCPPGRVQPAVVALVRRPWARLLSHAG